MNNAMFLLATSIFITACSNNNDKTASASGNQATETKTSEKDTVEKKSTDVTTNIDYEKGLNLVLKSDCNTCHKIAEKTLGPSYVDIANRYTGKMGIEDTMAQKIIKGGSGNWGTVPMPPHPNIPVDDARAMSKYVLSLRQP